MPVSFNQAFDVMEAGFRSAMALSGVRIPGARGDGPFLPRGYDSPWRHAVTRKLALRELQQNGPGLGGAIFGRPVKGTASALHGIGGFGYLMPFDIAISAATAKRGNMAAAIGGSVVGTATSLAGTVLGGMLGGPIGALAGGIAGDYIGRTAAAGAITKAAAFGKHYHRLDFGNGFRDNQQLLTMRQVAAQEMGGSLLNARQYLGKEALLMHQ